MKIQEWHSGRNIVHHSLIPHLWKASYPHFLLNGRDQTLRLWNSQGLGRISSASVAIYSSVIGKVVLDQGWHKYSTCATLPLSVSLIDIANQLFSSILGTIAKSFSTQHIIHLLPMNLQRGNVGRMNISLLVMGNQKKVWMYPIWFLSKFLIKIFAIFLFEYTFSGLCSISCHLQQFDSSQI